MNALNKRLATYNDLCIQSSIETTKAYSTSFSLSIRALAPDIRNEVYAIYGLVRFADEIVDSFHGYDQTKMLERFKQETLMALEEGISTNPVIQSFQRTFRSYGLECEHVLQFFKSMEWDLNRTAYDRDGFDNYVVGSAEVVGLMCLKVFVRGDEKDYERLKPAAMRLGAAFQKINFLRDLREDYVDLGRSYFPGVDVARFDDVAKAQLEREIDEDLRAAHEGIVLLPPDARFGVQLAFTYFRQLLRRIQRVNSRTILEKRVRVPDFQKALLLASTYTRHRLRLI